MSAYAGENSSTSASYSYNMLVFRPYDTHMWFLCEVWIFIFVFIVDINAKHRYFPFGILKVVTSCVSLLRSDRHGNQSLNLPRKQLFWHVQFWSHAKLYSALNQWNCQGKSKYRWNLRCLANWCLKFATLRKLCLFSLVVQNSLCNSLSLSLTLTPVLPTPLLCIPIQVPPLLLFVRECGC
jgi:hypothetical protein